MIRKIFLKLTIILLLGFVEKSIAQELITEFSEFDMTNAIDMHVHSGPDIYQRSVTDYEAALTAKGLGFKAIVLKNHIASTAARAEILNQRDMGITVFGGIVLNKSVGGINLQAVENMMLMSPSYGRVVWLPTFDASTIADLHGQSAKLQVIDGDGNLVPELIEILELIAKHNLILATGHIKKKDIFKVVEKAIKLGVKRIVITHAMADVPNLSVTEMQTLVSKGVFFELTYLTYLSGERAPIRSLRGSKHVDFSEMVKAIKIIGAENFVISSDLGQSGNPIPSDGLRQFTLKLKEYGCSDRELKLVLIENPGFLLNSKVFK